MKNRTPWIWFWLCCTATLLLPFYVLLMSTVPFLNLLALVFFPAPIGLCFASSACVDDYPQLAKLGMYSLVFMVFLSCMLLLIFNR